MRMRTERGALRVAIAAYVLAWSAHTTFVFYFAPIALRVAGAAERDAWVFAGTAIASILAVIPAGRMADAWPRRRVLRIGLAFLTASYIPLLFAPSVEGVLVATLFTGTGLAFSYISFHAYVADLMVAGNRSSSYGKATATAVVAAAIGPAIGGLVFEAIPADADALRVNALIFIAAALAGVALTFILPSAQRTQATQPSALDAWRRDAKTLGPFTLLHTLLGFGYGMTLPYFTVHFLDTLDMPNATWGLVLAAGTAASATGSLLAGRLGRSRAPRPIMLGGQSMLLLASLAFVLPLSVGILAVAYVARNLFAMSVGPLASSMLMSRVAPDARGRAQGFVTLGWNVGWAAGAFLGAPLLHAVGGALFPIGAVLGLAGVALALSRLREAPPLTATAPTGQ